MNGGSRFVTVSIPHALTAGADCPSQIVASTVTKQLPILKAMRCPVKPGMTAWLPKNP